jgi:hypothetical protein
MAWAEAWGAALPMAPTWVLGSVAVWLSAMPMPLQWGWLLAWRSPLELQWASASVYLLLPRRKYRPAPNHRHYLVGLDRRIASKQYGRPRHSRHRGLA